MGNSLQISFSVSEFNLQSYLTVLGFDKDKRTRDSVYHDLEQSLSPLSTLSAEVGYL